MDKIKAILEDHVVKMIEDMIILTYDGYRGRDYSKHEELLQIRKEIINRQVLRYEDVLLNDIVRFNEVMREALYKLFERADCLYKQVEMVEKDKKNRIKPRCYLDYQYPELHPVQGEDRQELWSALGDSGWNGLYEDGVNNICYHPGMSFEKFVGLDVTPPYWDDGLGLCKDIPLIYPFHNMYDHTYYALTDFVFCRKFRTEIVIEIEE